MKLTSKLHKDEKGKFFEVVIAEDKDFDKNDSVDVLLRKCSYNRDYVSYEEKLGGKIKKIGYLFLWYKIKDELDQISDLKKRLNKLFNLKITFEEIKIYDPKTSNFDLLISLINNYINFTELILSKTKEGTKAEDKTVSIMNKIKWSGSETELIYLFELLFKENLIDINQYQERFSLISKHFINRKEEPFNNKQLAQANQNISVNKGSKPKRAKLIETLITPLKKT